MLIIWGSSKDDLSVDRLSCGLCNVVGRLHNLQLFVRGERSIDLLVILLLYFFTLFELCKRDRLFLFISVKMRNLSDLFGGKVKAEVDPENSRLDDEILSEYMNQEWRQAFLANEVGLPNISYTYLFYIFDTVTPLPYLSLNVNTGKIRKHISRRRL